MLCEDVVVKLEVRVDVLPDGELVGLPANDSDNVIVSPGVFVQRVETVADFVIVELGSAEGLEHLSCISW